MALGQAEQTMIGHLKGMRYQDTVDAAVADDHDRLAFMRAPDRINSAQNPDAHVREGLSVRKPDFRRRLIHRR